MRVLLINDYGVPTGGAEIMTIALRDELRRRGHDARLFSSSAAHPSVTQMADYVCRGTRSRWRTVLQTVNPWAAWRLRQVLAEFRPQVVHVILFLTQLSPAILPLLKAWPTVYYAVWYRAICPTGTKLLPSGQTCTRPAGRVCWQEGCLTPWDWVLRMIQTAMLRRWRSVFRHIVPCSKIVGQRLRMDGMPTQTPIWHGVVERPARPPQAGPPMIAYAGRLVREKGVDVLIRAFASLATSHAGAGLMIIGDGPERAALEQLAGELGVGRRTTFYGFLPQAEAERHLDQAWAQVVPSLWAEPFGLVAAEGLMRGTAVVASATGGLAEIVQHGKTGWLVPPGRVGPLCQALNTLITQPELTERLGQAGRAFALEHLTITAMTQRWEAVYHTLGQE